MPKYNDTTGKKMSCSILKNTTDRKRKKPLVDPLPEKKIKFKTDLNEPGESTLIVSELNVLPDFPREDRFTERLLDSADLDIGTQPDFKIDPSPSCSAVDPFTPDDTPCQESSTLQQDVSPSDQNFALDPSPPDDTPCQENNTLQQEVSPSDQESSPPDDTPCLESSTPQQEVTPSDQESSPPDDMPCPEVPEKYTEYYVNGYCLRNDSKDQYYARDHSGDEMYWKDSVNAEIYAYKSVPVNDTLHQMEYPAVQKNEPKYIYDRAGKPRYPVDLTTQKVIFPKNPETHEEMYLPDKLGNLFYPENKFGQQFYRKDAEGNEVLINNTYAQFPDGSQIYPKKSNEDEFYLKLGNLEVPAVKKVNQKSIPFYAQKKNGDQIYPREYLMDEESPVVE